MAAHEEAGGNGSPQYSDLRSASLFLLQKTKLGSTLAELILNQCKEAVSTMSAEIPQ